MQASIIHVLKAMGALAFMLPIYSTLLTWFPGQVPSPQSAIAAAIPPAAFKLSLAIAVLVPVLVAKKDMVWPYLLAYIVPAIVWYGANRGNYWSIIWLVFVGIPSVEYLAGEDGQNPTEEEEKQLLKNGRFRLVTMAWVPVQFAFLVWALWAASTWDLRYEHGAMKLTWNKYGYSSFVFIPVGINISHELIHKPTAIERDLGKCLLAMVCYGHWFTEHLYGHHKEVSTPDDPATSKLGETFYAFWPRSVFGSFNSAWKLEKVRAAKRGYGLWSLQNPTLQMAAGSIAFAVFALVGFGPKSLALFLIQASVAFSLLELINYIEHYGLSRKSHIKKDGKTGFEPVNPLHSWNADTSITNYFLFKLQRHSDHHAFASRRYQILRTFQESPQMPTGYAGMIVMALIPPLWFWVMNDRVRSNEEKLNTSNERKEWEKNWKAYQ